MSNSSTTRNANDSAAIPENFEGYLEERIKYVRRGTRIRVVVGLALLLVAVLGLVFLMSYSKGFVEHPGWVGQVVEDEVAARMPYWIEHGEQETIGTAPIVAKRLSDEVFRTIARARRNSEVDVRNFAQALVAQTDNNLEALLDEVVKAHKKELKGFLKGAPDPEAIRNLEDKLVSTFGKALDEKSKAGPRLMSVDLLVAASGKLVKLEQAKELTIEELFEREFLTYLIEYLAEKH